MTTTNKLDVLLAKVVDPRLRAELTAEVAALRSTKRFGLVFEEHLPETVRLPQAQVRRGATVQHRDAPDGPLLSVTRVKDGVARLVDADGVESSEAVANLVVVRAFGQPIHPGLDVLERIDRGPVDAPHHLVLNAENHHALEMLRFTHRAAVDLIYIDPPYNTGNEFVYNDRRVGADDAFRHSKWLSFMDRRLRLARTLLKPTGVIIVAIDDNEHAHLRLLMDQVFGSQNFLANVAWQGNVKNDARYAAGGLDYMVAYARDESALRENDLRWRERKPGVDEVLAAGAKAWEDSGHDGDEATRLLKAWWRQLPKDHPAQASKHYSNVCERTGRVYFGGPMISPNPRANLTYDVVDPGNGRVYPPPSNGWRVSREKMEHLIADGLILFNRGSLTRKIFLDEITEQNPVPSFRVDRRSASKHLQTVLGGKRFQFPKDVEVLMRWIDIVTQSNPDAVVLDFFAGSGSTTEAVLRLNAGDGGRRQSVVVTNNEVDAKTAKSLSKKGLRPGDDEWEAAGIFHHVTKPRVSTVVTGKRQDGSTYSEGLDANVTFAQMTYQDPDRVSLGMAFTAVAPLLWAKAGAIGPVIDAPTPGFACPDGATYAVLFDVGAWAGLVNHLEAHPDVRTVFVVTDSDAAYRQVTSELPTGLNVHRLYADYLTNFEINIDTGEGTL